MRGRRFLAVLRESQQFVHVEDLHAPAMHCDHPVVLQPAEAATDGFQRQTQEAGDVLAAHRQADVGRRQSDMPQALAQSVQEQRDAIVGLAPGEQWARTAGAGEMGGGLLTALGFMHPIGPIATFAVTCTGPVWIFCMRARCEMALPKHAE